MCTTYSLDYFTPIILDEERIPAGADSDLCPEHAKEILSIASAEICNGCGRPFPMDHVPCQSGETPSLSVENYIDYDHLPSNYKPFPFDEKSLPSNRSNYPQCDSFNPETTPPTLFNPASTCPPTRGNGSFQRYEKKKQMCFCGQYHGIEIDDDNLYTIHSFQKDRIKAYDKKKLLDNFRSNKHHQNENKPKFEYESVKGCIYVDDDDLNGKNLISSYAQDYSEFWKNKEIERKKEEMERKAIFNSMKCDYENPSNKDTNNKNDCNNETDKNIESIPIKRADCSTNDKNIESTSIKGTDCCTNKPTECSPTRVTYSPTKLIRSISPTKYDPCSKRISNQSTKNNPIRNHNFNPEHYLFVTPKLPLNKNSPNSWNNSKSISKCHTTHQNQNLDKCLSSRKTDKINTDPKNNNIFRNCGYYTGSTTSVQPLLREKNPPKKPLGMFSDNSSNSCIKDFEMTLNPKLECCTSTSPTFASSPSPTTKLNDKTVCKKCKVCEELKRRALMHLKPINRQVPVMDQGNCTSNDIKPNLTSYLGNSNKEQYNHNIYNSKKSDIFADSNKDSNSNKEQYNHNIYNSKKSDIFADCPKSTIKTILPTIKQIEILRERKKQGENSKFLLGNFPNCTARSIGCILCKNASTTISNNAFLLRNQETNTTKQPLKTPSYCSYISKDKLKTYIQQFDKNKKQNNPEWRFDVDIDSPESSQKNQSQPEPLTNQNDQKIWKPVPVCYCCENCLYANLCDNCLTDKRIIDLALLRK